MNDDQNPGPLTPLGTPGPLTQAAIDKAKALPDNQLAIDAATSDFRSVDLSVGLKKTWRNGWGVGGWVGAKLSSGKPIGSAGVTVTKTIGLLGEVDAMNWLQRNLPSRESWAWSIVTIGLVLGFLSAHFDLLQAAFEVGPRTQARIELLAGLAALLTAKQSFSWMPSKLKQEQAREVHAVEQSLTNPRPPSS